MAKLLDLSGFKFNRLTAIKRVGTSNDGKALWLFKCDCGKEIVTRGSGVKTGRVKSCGCYNKERIIEVSTTHGMRHSRLYGIWKAMKQRCYYKKGENYKHYGARGIAVCDEWRKNFNSFYSWAMSNGYQEHLTIERKDVNKNYCPENCEWIPRKEQGVNKSSTIWIKARGEIRTMSDWAREAGISISAISSAAKRECDLQEYVEFKLKNPNRRFYNSKY